MHLSRCLLLVGVLGVVLNLEGAEPSAPQPSPSGPGASVIRIVPKAGGFTTEGDGWISGVDQSGGSFSAAPGGAMGWTVDARQPFGVGTLTLRLDRQRAGARVGLMIFSEGGRDQDFTVQLFDDAGRAVAVDLFGNLASVGDGPQVRTVLIPLSEYPSARRIVLRRLQGDLRVTEAFVFPVQEPTTFEPESLRDLARLLGDPLSPDNPLLRAAAPGPGRTLRPEDLDAIALSAPPGVSRVQDARLALEALNRVLASGLDFNANDFVRMARDGQTEIVRVYLLAGMPIDAEDELGFSALMAAAGTGRIPTMAALLDQGADINSIASIERTPLAYATEQLQAGAVRFLLLRKADPNVPNAKGATPLAHIASWTAEEATIIRQLLVDAGANVNAQAHDGRTPLINASRAGHTDAMLFLLDQGANLHVRDASGRTAMDWAVSRGLERAGRLLEVAGGGRFEMPVDTPQARLFSGAKIARHDWVEQAIKAGADVRARDEEGRSAFLWAALHGGNQAILRTLLTAGADPNQADAQGETALHHLAQWWGGNVNERIAFLIENGASLDARDRSGVTPLMRMAARATRGLHDKWNFVLQFRPDPTLRDNRGRTAQDIARAHGNDLVAEILATYEATWQVEPGR